MKSAAKRAKGGGIRLIPPCFRGAGGGAAAGAGREALATAEPLDGLLRRSPIPPIPPFEFGGEK